MNEERIYENLCAPTEVYPDCEQRAIRLSAVYAAGSCGFSLAQFAFGFTLDKLGPLRTATLSSALAFFGHGLFGISAQPGWNIDAFIPGFFLIGAGGAGIGATGYHLAHLFPNRSGLVVSLLQSTAGISGLVYAIFLVCTS
jgi:MFS family permease